MASSSSSSSSYASKVYDVFFSFRGDTRKNFIDHLYTNLRQAGVNIFRDDEGIEKGENIYVELFKAIEESKISIIVFSKTYARSRWCLDELVKIMERKKQLKHTVFPIFYDVDPSEVRNQTGEFGDALARHRERFGEQKVDEWKTALAMAANLSGWDLQTMANGFESKFINIITKEVLVVLNFMPMNVAKRPVGIDSRVRDILDILKIQINDGVQMIGIFGMGGIGKSTLAKVIYNHLIVGFQGFDGSCFVASIRSEISKGHNGLVGLQRKLLRKILKIKEFDIGNVDEGISLIKARLKSKRVLIVLDEIDHISQLESLAGQRNWFGLGSIVIITTRNAHLLSDIRAHEKYEIEALSSNESLQLLSWHAFGVPIPPTDYTQVSERIVSYTGGLPLALTFLGSHLRGRSVEEWSNNIEKLRLMPPDDVQEILRISYDTLDDDIQSIFLDIACIFIGLDKNDTIQDFGFRYEIGIRTLTERCLLTIHRNREKEKLQMHDLVREMARSIVRKESPRDPCKRSRVMDPDDVYEVLHGDKGTEAIEGMYVDSNMLKNEPLSTKIFSRMKKLRLLKLDGVHLKGSFKNLPKELRWLWWHNCHSRRISSDFRHANLEVLHLQGSKINRVQLSMQHFKSLKILNLGGCEQLIKTPNFTGTPSLQILCFKHCSNLVQLHPSIGSLERLIQLDLTFCEKLKELPISICHIKSLQFLYLSYCSTLQEFPIELGKLKQLRKLLAHGTNISHLPFSLGCLRNLKILSVGRHNHFLQPKLKSHLPNSNLVGFFPPTVANLCFLEALYITDNYLREIDLPINLQRLSSLKVLSLRGSYCVESLPFTLLHLSRLENLELEECLNLKELRQLPSSLEKLSAKGCVSLEKIANISNLKRLKELYLPNCKSLVELPGLESLDSIQRLEITNCTALSIPLIESCFQAHSKGDDVEIWLQMVGSFLYCTIPSVLTHEFFDIIHGGFDPNCSCEARIIVKNKMSGALMVKEVTHVDCTCLKHHHPLTFHFRLEDDIVVNTSERFHFKVGIKDREELELYAVLYPLKIYYCLCVLHRNMDGEVHFFPSTKGLLEFDEIVEFRRAGGLLQNQNENRVRATSQQNQKSQFLVQGEMASPSLIPPPILGFNVKAAHALEPIQKLVDEATRLVAQGSKLKSGVLEFLQSKDLNKEATTPEQIALHMLKVQSDGYIASLEMTQRLMEALKKYEVECKDRPALENCSINYKQEAMHQCHQAD